MRGVVRCAAGLVAVAGLVTTMVAATPGIASASVAGHRPPRPGGFAVGGSGLSLAQAPAGLRAAVRRTPGLRAAGAGSTWSQQAELTASGGAAGDQLGWSVAISGSTAVVGAPGSNTGGGAAYVFVKSGSTWSQQAMLADPGNISGDGFGNSVAVSGSTAVVGAPGTFSTAGAAYVFVRSGTTWSQQTELTDPGASVNDQFGTSVAISGSTAVIGAPGGAGAGLAYVFVRAGTTWSQQAELGASDAASGDDFGYSVAISGSTALVGNPFSNANTGAAYVFVRSGVSWSQQAELTAVGGASGDKFGYSVAISGTTAVVGADAGNSGTGAAYTFVRAGTAWSQQAELTASGGASGDNFGRSVAITGTSAVVGADGSNSNTGAAYVFAEPASPCGTAKTAPTYKHVIVIMDENHSYGDIIGSSLAPYINTVAAGCGLASEYHNITHDSLPNYLGITSGLSYPSLLHFDSDCLPSSSCEVTTNNIFNQASSWKEYAESMPSNCYKLNDGTYAPRHNPSVYYTDLANCATNDVPLGTTGNSPLLKDFSSESTAPAFAYVTGNLCDDMHGVTGCKTGLIQAGDTWLSEWLPKITSSRVYKDKDTVIFLVWDEGTKGTKGESCFNNTTDQTCHVPAIVIAPSVKAGTVVSTQFDHYSWLKTTEQLLGLPQIGQAKTATSMKTPFHL
jgi:FG-GAP repeat/Phosphoesterase family